MEHLHCGEIGTLYRTCISEEMVLGDWESEVVEVFG